MKKEYDGNELDYYRWYQLGFEEGHSSGLFSSEKEELEYLRQKCSSLENLLSANIRVIKQNIINEQKQQTEEEDGCFNSGINNQPINHC